VVGIAVLETVWHVEADLVIVTDTVLQPLTERVNGWVVGMAVLEIVPEPLSVGRDDAPTVGIESEDLVIVTDVV